MNGRLASFCKAVSGAWIGVEGAAMPYRSQRKEVKISLRNILVSQLLVGEEIKESEVQLHSEVAINK